VQLLQRFYNFDGEILVDGVPISDYDIHHLRSFFATVNQEPSLFTGTIGDNIKYNHESTEEEVTEAARKA
jgi:ABC-type multidrug transport system fused ATPase/permease subunit